MGRASPVSNGPAAIYPIFNLIERTAAMQWSRLIAAGALIAAAGSAQSALINVQFGRDFHSPETQVGPAVIGSAGDVWNDFRTELLTTSYSGSLVDSNGAATGFSIFYTMNGSSTVAPDVTVWQATDYSDLMRGYLWANDGSPKMIEISGLPVSTDFEIYLYTQGDSAGNNRQLTVTPAGGATVTSTAAVASANTFIEGQNYLIIDASSNASGVLSLSYNFAAGEANINGFQMQEKPAEAPEPASLGLLAAGGVLLARVRRRRSRSAA